MSEMMTIGEFAARTGLSVSALRFYDGRGLLEPADVDPSSGYRRYVADQIADGVLIRDLRRLDMALSEIGRALELSPQGRQNLVADHLRRLESIVERAHAIAHEMGLDRSKETNDMSTTILNGLDFSRALEQVLPAAGANPEVPHLMSVLVESKEGSIRLVATDRHRLAVRDLVPIEATSDFACVVPAATLSRWAGELNTAGPVEIRADEREIHVAADGSRLSGVTMPVEFPDYEPLLQRAPEATSVLVDRGDLISHLQRVRGKSVVVAVTPAGLGVRDAEDVRHLEASVDGPSIEVVLSVKFLVEAARSAVGPEMAIELLGPLDPVLFRSVDDGSYVSLVMPIKEEG